MKQKEFDKKIEALIEEAISKFKQYDENTIKLFPVYAEYDDPKTTLIRRIELSTLMAKNDILDSKACDIIYKLGKQLNSHDFNMALNRINKAKKDRKQLWEEYEQWKTARSTMVV